jgi:protein-tyrosine sulfotransferase
MMIRRLGSAQVPAGVDVGRPVFALTMARCGSTLLRFIRDSHPGLACPPETGIGYACRDMLRVWGALYPPLEPTSGQPPPDRSLVPIPADAAEWVRSVLDGMYLTGHGKSRWCDKSLDNVKMAGLFAQLYPDAQFICLFRHCMDVVFSAIEATPVGLTGYGLDKYVAGNPGNAVAAAAHGWVDQTSAIMDFQARFPTAAMASGTRT